MTDPFDGPRRKLERAHHHFADVRTILDDLRNDNSRLARQDYNHAEGRYEFSLQDDWALSPDLPLIVGDVLHNARSSLDHIAWALAEEPTRATGFPIIDPASPISVTEFAKRNQVKSMKASAIAKLEQMQPYNSAGVKTLWWLNELDIADKHHLILRTELQAPGFGFSVPEGYDVLPLGGVTSVQRGTAFAVAIGPFNPSFELQIKPHVEVVIAHPPTMQYPLEWTLSSIFTAIELHVLAAFTESDFPS